jgi:peptidoglycan/xylan/chitin deacetylase (PgdA/CDA1 family)
MSARIISWLLVMALVCGCTAPSRAPTSPKPGVTRVGQQSSESPSVEPAVAGTATAFASAAPTVTAAPTASATASPTGTAAPSRTPTATATPRPTATPPPTATQTPTPGPTPDGITRTLRVPILMYHYISTPPDGADIYRRDLSVSPALFEGDLKYLADAGYHVITLDDLLYALAQGRELPAKPVILTFDDGYEDNYTNAFPLLQKYDMVGNFFIISDFVNQERPGYMTWPQIEEMAAAGQHFGSHSRDHPNLSGQSVDYLVWQALGGKEALEEHLGQHPLWISYPSGQYDDRTIAVYKSAGYWGGLTTQQGATHTLDGIFELKRVRVRGSHTTADLGRLLALDW